MTHRRLALALLALSCAAPAARAAPSPLPRPELFLKEEWRQNDKGDEHPASQQSVGSSAILTLHGPDGKDMQVTGKAGDAANPIHLWTGLCTSPCGMTLRDPARMADLGGLARIRWNTKISGFHRIHPVVRLADGAWLVGEAPAGSYSTRDWLTSEFTPSELRWIKFDPARAVATGPILEKADLSKVDEVGFVDLMPSSGHGPGGWIDVAQFEVYAKPVPR